MHILIVESKAELASLWQRHLCRIGLSADCVETADQALDAIVGGSYSVVVINLGLPTGGAFGIADYVRVKNPDTKVVLITDQTFFRDGSLFGLVPNLRMTLAPDTPPEDVALIVSHYAAMA